MNMKKKRYSEEQIIKVLKENEAGMSVEQLARKHNVAAGTIYRWRNQYGGMEINELKKLKSLEEENRRLKRLVADLSLDNQMLKDINSKNW
jgi:putative transposase